jgi:hypothetical protein
MSSAPWPQRPGCCSTALPAEALGAALAGIVAMRLMPASACYGEDIMNRRRILSPRPGSARPTAAPRPDLGLTVAEPEPDPGAEPGPIPILTESPCLLCGPGRARSAALGPPPRVCLRPEAKWWSGQSLACRTAFLQPAGLPPRFLESRRSGRVCSPHWGLPTRFSVSPLRSLRLYGLGRVCLLNCLPASRLRPRPSRSQAQDPRQTAM